MSGLPIFVGVDGGEARTVAVVGRGASTFQSEDDVVLGRGEAGPANPQTVGFENAANEITNAIGRAVANASPKAEQAPFNRVTLGIIGASRPTHRPPLR